MGIGEVEDLMARAEKKKRKSARRAAKQRAQQRQARPGEAQSRPSLLRRASVAGIVDAGQASANAMAGFTSSVTSILRNRSGTLSRRHRRMSGPGDIEEGEATGNNVEMEILGTGIIRTSPEGSGDGNDLNDHRDSHRPQSAPSTPSAPSRVEFSEPADRESRARDTSNSETSSTSATPSLHPPRTLGQLFSFPTTWLQVYLRKLQKAHQEAARKQVLQRVEIREQDAAGNHHAAVTGRDPDEPSPGLEGLPLGDEGAGWGLGSFGIKEHQESAKRLEEARTRMNEDRLLPSTGHPHASSSSRREAGTTAEDAQAGPSRHRQDNTGRDGTGGLEGEDQWEDMEDTSGSGTSSSGDVQARDAGENKGNSKKGKRKAGNDNNTREAGGDDENNGDRGGRGGAGSSWSWWGPLKDWRLADRSAF